MDSYTFPTSGLARTMSDPSRTPLCLVSCGSFSPITYLHLRMFEMAADYVKANTEFEIIGAYLSPVGDAYKKLGLAEARHRVAMCTAAVSDNPWIMVDDWEASQITYQPTAQVLDHFEHEINARHGGVLAGSNHKPIKIKLLAGADLIQTMSVPDVWSQDDLEHILGQYGTFIVERSGTDIEQALATLQKWRDNIWVIRQLIQNDVSSTKIRLFLRHDLSVKYLIPPPVIEYIEENSLYEDDGQGSEKEKDKEKVKEAQKQATSLASIN